MDAETKTETKTETQAETPTNAGLTSYLCFCTFVSVIGSSFLYGYNVGDLNTPATIINETFYMKVYSERAGVGNSTDGDANVGATTVALWQLTVALFVAGGAVGSLGSGWICETLGRRNGNAVNQIPAILCGILSFAAKSAGTPELLMAGRFLAGLSAGAGCTYVPVYLTEIAPTQYRGAIATMHQLALTIGILIAQILSLPIIWGNESNWPILVGFVMVPAVISLLLLPFCVESPRFLYMQKNNPEAARAALQRLRGSEDVDAELDQMKKEKLKDQSSSTETYTFAMLFGDKANYLPLIATIAMQILQQWSGINAVMFYSALIFQDAGVEPDQIPYAVVGTGVVNVLTTVLAVFVIERAGRRPLILIPCLIITIIYFLLTACLTVKEKFLGKIYEVHAQYDVPLTYSVQELKGKLNCTETMDVTCEAVTSDEFVCYIMAMVTIVCIIIYIISFAIGLGPIPMYITSEMFRQAPRTSACAIAQGINWACNLLLAQTFLYLQGTLGSFTFIPFMIVVATVGLFVFIRVPETKGRSFDQIARILDSRIPAYRINARDFNDNFRKPDVEDQELETFTKNPEA